MKLPSTPAPCTATLNTAIFRALSPAIFPAAGISANEDTALCAGHSKGMEKASAGDEHQLGSEALENGLYALREEKRQKLPAGTVGKETLRSDHQETALSQG